MKLRNKVALVTGGSKGIGQAIAFSLSREGADVVVNYAKDEASASQTLSNIIAIGRKALAIKADVANPHEVDLLVDNVITEFGKIDILVNNAGFAQNIIPTTEQDIEDWDKVIGVHLRGTYLCSRRVGKEMIRQGEGKILNISSVVGMTGIPMRTAYGPAKAGIINLTMVLASEWGPYHINVNCIAPGRTMTDLLKRLLEEGKLDPEAVKEIPMGRWGTCEDIANAAVFLVSEDAAYINGVTLPIDGGWLAWGRTT